MSPRIKIAGIFVALLLAGFLAREYFISRPSLLILGEKNLLFMRTQKGQFFSFGKNQSRSDALLHAVRSYFSPENVVALESGKSGKEMVGEGATFQIFSPEMIRGKLYYNVLHYNVLPLTFWLIGEPAEETLLDLKSQPIPLTSDFWVLKKSAFPEFLPLPREGILFLGERVPSKALQTFAREHSIPLISVAATDGFSLTRTGEKWILRVRK